MPEDIALFIDFENIRYSMLNIQRREPDPQELIAVARRYGTVMVARAYADWSRQPEPFKGSLTAAMIDRVDCPAKQRDRIRMGTIHYNYPGYVTEQGIATLPSTPFARQWPSSVTGQSGSLPAINPHGNHSWYNDQDHAASQGDLDEGADEPADDDTLTDETYGNADYAARDSYRQGNAYGSFAQRTPSGPLGQTNTGPLGYATPYQHSGNTGHMPAINGNNNSTVVQSTVIQSTVDLNMLMDIIETVFDRPTISTFVLMTGDKDFTRISARLKLRLNKTVIIVGIPGTVSRDLISSANQFVPLVPNGINISTGNTGTMPAIHPNGSFGSSMSSGTTGTMPAIGNMGNTNAMPAINASGSTGAMPAVSYPGVPPTTPQAQPAHQFQMPHSTTASSNLPIDVLDPQFLQFLDYIDRNWSWRTIIGVSNFIGDPVNPKNRFRGRLTRESARELLNACIQQGILLLQTDSTGAEDLRLNRMHPGVEEVLKQFVR